MSSSGLVSALAGIKRRFIGEYGAKKTRINPHHIPHQGQQEMARRVRQAAKRSAK